MQLLRNWRRVLRDAWSSRLIVAAALLSGLEVVMPLFAASFPLGVFALASFGVTAAALVARIVAQPGLHQENENATQSQHS